MSRRRSLLHAAVFGCSLLMLLLAGCPVISPPTGSEGTGEAKLVPFDSSGDLLSYFKQQASARYSSRGAGFFGLLGAPTAAEDAQGSSNEGAGDDNYSTTNVQEVGVDESDVFKSDGAYFYVARDASLRIVDAVPADGIGEVGRLDLTARVDALYLVDSTVITLGTQYGGYDGDVPEILIWPPYYGGSEVVISQIDVSDPASPTLVKEVTLDGSAVSSRLVNGRLIVVLTVAPQLPANPTPLNISTMTLDDVMPKMRSGNEAAEAVPWNRWLRPASPDGYNMTTVMTLDAADVENVIESVAVLANAGTIYASPDALYLTDAEYDPDDNYREVTAIHKLTFGEDGAARYTASGAIPGRLLNQFSLGEYDGYLRAATHVNNFGAFPMGMGGADIAVAVSGGAPSTVTVADATAQVIATQPYNAVYVLGENGAQLEVVGLVDGLAPGEQIHSARFMGERGFLVTFVKVDPLFALDLSDPTNPEVVGELKIPGYSDYLHPLGDDHLIGVGNSVVPASFGGVWWNKLQLSLFDVSDLTNPTLVQQLEVGGFRSWADARDTHKAFTLVERDGQTLLALPSHLTPVDTPVEVWANPEFEGVLCFSVDAATGFTELGRISSVVGDSPYGWWMTWQRAAFIGDALYAITADGVRAAAISDFGTTHEMAFTD